MQKNFGVLYVLIAIGTLAGLIGARYRLHVEERNRREEIGLEWDEVSRLAQFTHTPLSEILNRFRAEHVSTLIVQEDTFTTLEQSGAIHPERSLTAEQRLLTHVVVPNLSLFHRITHALQLRGVPEATTERAFPEGPLTLISEQTPEEPAHAATQAESTPSCYVPVDYANLRTIGVGLPTDACEIANREKMQIAGRISNFPGVTPDSARNVLQDLADQGVSTVIFNGEEVLGYNGQEKAVASLLVDGAIPIKEVSPSPPTPPRYLAYGAIEFGKQKGDEKLSADLKGDFIRVHSIQTGEMGQMSKEEAIDRFVKAAKERNIRFCYVRLYTFAGSDAVQQNVEYLNAIARGMHHGSALTGGDLGFGPARRYPATGVPGWLYPLLGLGVAAGTIWMLCLFCPLPRHFMIPGLALLGLICVALSFTETGRKLLALLAGISFPAAACLLTFPRCEKAEKPRRCISLALSRLVLASLITTLGIVHVVGLLATRAYMVHASQFLGIKAQHAIPFLIVTFAAVLGGVAAAGENWPRYCARARSHLQSAMQEPARFGLLIFGIVVLAALVLIIARTGNDAGVGVSGFELKARAILDKILPVRPRTKEFLVGHPAFVLGIAWWFRGRKKLAMPAFVIGSLGQVSLLNTFCHIHTPLIISAWRDLLGLILGAALGIALFLVIERIFPAPRNP